MSPAVAVDYPHPARHDAAKINPAKAGAVKKFFVIYIPRAMLLRSYLSIASEKVVSALCGVGCNLYALHSDVHYGIAHHGVVRFEREHDAATETIKFRV